MFYNALNGAVAVRDEIERIVDPTLVPDDAVWTKGFIFGGHNATRRTDYLDIRNHLSLLGSYNVQAYRDEVDTLMGDYTMMFPYWIGFPKTKAVKVWLDYMQWLAMYLVQDDPTSASFASRQEVEYGGERHLSEMVVFMFASTANATAFLNSHANKDYRLDPDLGINFWRTRMDITR